MGVGGSVRMLQYSCYSRENKESAGIERPAQNKKYVCFSLSSPFFPNPRHISPVPGGHSVLSQSTFFGSQPTHSKQ